MIFTGVGVATLCLALMGTGGVRVAAAPSLQTLASSWVNPDSVLSNHTDKLPPSNRDLPTINNFWGSVGICPEEIRPVDLFAINSLELPPFAGCGSGGSTPYGCGAFTIDGQHVDAVATRWLAHEAGRRSAPVAGSGVVVESATRMAFERNAVLWVINVSNPTAHTVRVNASFTLAPTISQFATVGTWVYPAPNDPGAMNFSAITGGSQQGVQALGLQPATGKEKPAASRYIFVGLQPDSITTPSAPQPALDNCSIAGNWTQLVSGQTFGPIVVTADQKHFSWDHNPYKRDGWSKFNGTVDGGNKYTLTYYRDTGAHVEEHGSFVRDCDHMQWGDSAWARPGLPPTRPSLPSATFNRLQIEPGETRMLQVALSIGATVAEAEETEAAVAGDSATFAASWLDVHSKWEERWQQAFTPDNGFFSGHLPSLELADATAQHMGVGRLFFMSILSVLSELRTNLRLVYPHVWENGNGNVGHTTMGIGGSRSWWWDEGLTSMMLALLEPAGRQATLQAWLAHDQADVFGHGLGNGYALDCEPVGSGSCTYRQTKESPNAEALSGPEYGFYCYNPWAYYLTISNHLRLNNDSAFLLAQAANSSKTVDGALEVIVTDWKEYVINGTHLIDYGPSMDGFSPTYKHVMPGCSQGNNVVMLRDFARLREAQGRSDEAMALRADAEAIMNDTMQKMYTSTDGRGWFNVIFPKGSAASPSGLTAYEMRHVVDFFSVSFGACGLGTDSDAECGFSPRVRRELGNWFRSECVTKNWIRATSPRCNCTNTWDVPLESPQGGPPPPSVDEGQSSVYPAYQTCAAGRPDHGSDGAYPAWPAFSMEALCYVDGNCSSAYELMTTHAETTFEGPLGQAKQVPQSPEPPFTPFNDESAFKPTAGVTRYIAIEGGAFFDAIVRGFFGYHPPPIWGTGDPQSLLDKALYVTGTGRGFEGKLTNLRTPVGLATITSSPGGLSIELQ